MMDLASPYEGLKILGIGIFFGYLIGKYRFRKPKTYEFANLRFGDLGEKKRIKL